MTGTWHSSTCTQFSLLSVVEESTKLQKEGLHTGADLAPLGRSEVEVIEEKKQIKSEGPKNTSGGYLNPGLGGFVVINKWHGDD